MATRSLTEVFILMRNNAMQSRHIYSEQNMTDRMALVSRDSDIEAGMEMTRGRETQMPPIWVDGLEEAQYLLSRVRKKLGELESLHIRHLHRPTLDDSSEEEQQIEALTQEITRLFGGAHRLVQQIQQQSQDGSQKEHRLSLNVMSSLVSTLQELSSNFRISQSTYLRKLNSREERSQQYFNTLVTEEESGGGDWENDRLLDQSFTQQELLLLEDNTRMVAQREQEVRKIMRSIVDLNEIFKDLSHMVVDQGTILDRIDYNVEQVQVQVHDGLQQLQKADHYQKKSRKMMCILILASASIFLIVMLVVVKS